MMTKPNLSKDMRHRSAIYRKYIKPFIDKEDGGISIMGAFSLIPILGVFALSIDFGIAYSKRISNQSLADSIALSAALYYSDSKDELVMEKVAKEVSLAARLDPNDVTASIVVSPNNSNNEAVEVIINTPIQTYFGNMLGDYGKINGSVNSFVEIPEVVNKNCIIALSGDIRVTSRAGINANCGVGAKNNISLSTDGFINANAVSLGGTVSISSRGAVNTSPDANNINENLSNPVSDPFAGLAELETELNKIGNAESPRVPSVATGNDFDLPSSGNSYTFQGNNVTKSGSTWYAPSGIYNIRSLGLSGSKRLTFRSPSTITFSGNIKVTSRAKLEFGDGDIHSTGALETSTDGQITLGDGRHYFRSMSSGSRSSIQIGDGNIDVAENIFVGSDGRISIGEGDKLIGGNISVSSRSSLTLGNGELNIGGDVGLGSDGTFTLGSTPETYINGSLRGTSRSVFNFGSSRYFIDGDFGGSTDASYMGTDVSFFISGDLDVRSRGGSTLSAPSNDGDATVDTLIFVSRGARTARLSSDGVFNLTGTFYTPNASLEITSRGTLSGNGECALIVANDIRMSTDARLSTQCNNLSDAFSAGGGSSKIAVVM